VIAATLIPTAAIAQSSRHQFDIPAGPSAPALQTFARQSGLQILFPYDAVEGRRSRAIRGMLEDEQVLRRLAREAGLIVVSRNGKTVVLGRSPAPSPSPKRRAPAPRRQPPPAPLPPLEPPADIIVTATKRSEMALDVPASVTAIRGADLRTLGIANAADLQNIVPGISANTVQHGITLVIRGVTTTDITSKGEQGVAFNVDGIFQGRPIEQALSLFDIDRVEVLRGPQGTLYGKSSTGGAINVITNQPVDLWEGYGRLELGNFATLRAEGALNVPITPWLAVRAAADVNSRGAFLRSTDGSSTKSDERDQTIRISARARISGAITARLTATVGHVGGAGTGFAELGNFIDGATSAAKRSIYPNPFPSGLDHHFFNLNADVRAQIGGGELTYVGARQRFDGDELTANNNDPNDLDPAPYPGLLLAAQLHGRYQTGITTDVHEIRWSNLAPARFEYVVGANYLREKISENDHLENAPGGDPDPARSINSVDIIGMTRHRSWGLFGQGTLRLTDKLGVVAGLRYSYDGVRRVGTAAFGSNDANGLPCYGPADCIGNPSPGNESASKVTYRAGVNLQITPTQLFYASLATGYKAGGFNDIVAPNGIPTAYAPEQLLAYEAGYKGRPTKRLQLESTLFYYDYAKTQINGVIVLNGTGVLNTRVVPTIIYGWENELTWTVSSNTSVRLSAVFERSRYVHFLAGAQQNIDWSNLPLDRTPPLVAMATLNQSWAMRGGWSLKMRLFSKFSAPYYVSDFTSGLRFRQSAFTRSDASLTLAAPGERWYVQAFVQNIEDKLQALSPPQNYDPSYPNASYLNISDPRLFGIRLGFSFR